MHWFNFIEKMKHQNDFRRQLFCEKGNGNLARLNTKDQLNELALNACDYEYNQLI